MNRVRHRDSDARTNEDADTNIDTHTHSVKRVEGIECREWIE